ncbi:unnamed protein product, partial [Lampetra fluviatilis]
GGVKAEEAEPGDQKGAESAVGAEPGDRKWEEPTKGEGPGDTKGAESTRGDEPGDLKGEESAVGAEPGDQKWAEPRDGVGGAKEVGGVDPQTTFYGVCADWSTKKDGQTGGVFDDRALALQALRSLPGSRFKAFATRGEAEGFSLGDSGGPHGALTSDPPPRVGAMGVESPPSSYRSPRPQELVTVLRRAVEVGDLESFTRTVWDNPRYLVGSGDNPTILQEGCRYNALHVAARCGRPAVCLALLRTLSEPRFLGLLYPGDPESTLARRRNFLVDLYLNTPDRGACDSPLHFACKFGHAGVVRVLASHPAIDINRPNRDGLTPSQVICDRSAVKTAELKAKILSYLENRCFVPLLRSPLEPLSPPVIALPCPPSPLIQPPLATTTTTPRWWWRGAAAARAAAAAAVVVVVGGAVGGETSSRCGSSSKQQLALRAFAGPMSPSQALELRRLWRVSPRNQTLLHAINSDPERGPEHVGRCLAHSLGLAWSEYWEFLGAFLDLGSTEGLETLEAYLRGDHRRGNGKPAVANGNRRTGIAAATALHFLKMREMHKPHRIIIVVAVAGNGGSPLTTTSASSAASAAAAASSSAAAAASASRSGVERAGRSRSVATNLTATFNKLAAASASASSSSASAAATSAAAASAAAATSSAASSSVATSSSSAAAATSSAASSAATSSSSSAASSATASSSSAAPSSSAASSAAASSSAASSASSSSAAASSTSSLDKDVPSKLDQDVLVAVGDAPLDRSRLPLVLAWQRRVLNHSLAQRQQ